MFYPITLFLWAIMSHFAEPANTSAASVSIQEPFIAGDSSVYHELQAKLALRQTQTKPEKLYLQTDRTLYQPGETIWFNAYLRNAGDLMPSAASQILYVELLDARGTVLQNKNLLAPEGTAAGEFDLPAQMPGGLYKIRAFTNWMQNTEASFEREITLQKVVLPNLNLQLEFERKAFGPGDIAIARFDAASLDNQPLANQTLQFTASAAGVEFKKGQAGTDANGRAYIRFQLPDKLETADGLLNIQIEHKGQMEAISRPIPIVLNKIDLQFFPEGGDAVAGLPCRMGFKAVNEFGKPADVEGKVFDGEDRFVTWFSSYHDGMGAFDFLPANGKRYYAVITKPASTGPEIQRYPLSGIQSKGMSLRLQGRNGSALKFEVSASKTSKAFLVGSIQDKIFYFKELQVNTVARKVEITAADLPSGIARFTLLDAQKQEQAERLVFVNRDRGLHIDLKPDKDQYLPREKVKLDISVRDQAGNPVPGAFSLAVTDEKLLSYADDKQGHLLAALLLEQDVKGKIEEPNFYFDQKEPKSEQALDYLLMTQGWRRFAWKEVMSDTAPTFSYTNERMEVEGVLLKKNGKPWRDAEIRLYPDGPAVQTDKNGHFVFQCPDLLHFTHLEYPGKQYIFLNHYASGLRLQNIGTPQLETNYYSYPNPSAGTVLMGQIHDDQKEGLIGASVKVLKGPELVRGTITDIEGNFRLNLDPGTYSVEIAYTGFRTNRQTEVHVLGGKINFMDIPMTEGTALQEVMITRYKVPLIEQDMNGGTTLTSESIRSLPTGKAKSGKVRTLDKSAFGQTVKTENIKDIPTRNLNAVIATPADATSIDDGAVNIKGARANATNYYIDGIRIYGKQPPLVQDIEDVQVITGGLGAEYNDLSWHKSQPSVSRADSKKRKGAPDTIEEPYYNPQIQYDRAREFYVPPYGQQQTGTERTDFRSTIYWNPSIQTDKNGLASVEFYTSDAITNFRATLEGIGNAGQPGRTEMKFFAQKPISVDVKVPASVIVGDELRLQVAITNNTAYAVNGMLDLETPAHFQAIGAGKPDPAGLNVSVSAKTTKIIEFAYSIGRPATAAGQNISIRFRAPEAFEDVVETSIRTLDRGFPAHQVIAGNATQNTWNLHFSDPVEGTMSAKLTLYTSALDDVLKGMERMLRQPSGCFEQVSSSNYPNLLVLDLLKSNGATNPEIESRARDLLEDGYKKLTAYECKSGGFDWWGRDPAHEGLTAYGVLEFTDMAQVFLVDKTLIDRSVQWLLSRRDGKGGWNRREDWHGWQSEGVLGAYIAWAVTESGYGAQFKTEIERAYTQAIESGDLYQIALLANVMVANKDSRAKTLLAQLIERQEDNGSWMGATHSVMQSSGDGFRIETTALGILALLKSGEHAPQLQKAIDFIIRSKTEYGYGSTQSTVLALKALVEYTKTAKAQASDGVLVVQVDGKRVLEQAFSTRSAGKVEIKGLEQYFSGTDAHLEVFFEKTTKGLPFDIDIQYASRQPRNAPKCPLSFQTNLSQTKVSVGETLRLISTLKNESAEAAASPMIIVGIPAGLTLQPWQLKKLVDEKQCDYYELWDGFAVFHFEHLAAGETRRIALDLRADIAGTFEAPASQAFLYYDNNQRIWSKPEQITIAAK